MAPHSSTLAWKIPWTEEPAYQQAAVHGVARSRTRLSNFTFTFHFHSLEKEMATHSSVLAWRIPGTGVPSGLPSMGCTESDTTEATQQQQHFKDNKKMENKHYSLMPTVVQFLWLKTFSSMNAFLQQIFINKYLGWPNSSSGFFCNMLRKNPNKSFGQPNIMCQSLPYSLKMQQ